MSQPNDRLLQIADTLEAINEHLVLLSIDTEHYAMALPHCLGTHCLPLMPANRWTACYQCLKWRLRAMSDDTFIHQVMDGLKKEGFLMINDDFIDQLIITLHANVTIINTMTQLAELETKMLGSLLPTGSRQVNSLKELSTRIAEIAFNVEDVRNDQR